MPARMSRSDGFNLMMSDLYVCSVTKFIEPPIVIIKCIYPKGVGAIHKAGNR
jgi:hypothetical protein